MKLVNPLGRIIVLLIVFGSTSALARSTHTPQIFLNHFYVTLDANSFSAVENSEFLKEHFGVFEKRTTVQGNNVYSGIYFYGDDTYFEFFNREDRSSGAPSAIAFGVDNAGDMLAISPNLDVSLFTRLWNGRHLPWFRFGLYPAPESTHLYTWSMEYDPSFLEQWHPDLATPLGVTRAAVLERYAAALGVRQRDRQLKNVRALWVEMTAAELADFLPKVLAYGCTVVNGDKLVTVNTATESIYVKEGPANRIIAAEFELRSPASPRIISFGSTTLMIREDGTALWTF